MKRILAVLLIVSGAALVSFGQTTGAPAKTAAQQGETSAASWQTSYAKFVRELISYSGEKPEMTLTSLVNGQAVPRSWKIMQLYGWRTVTWEGIFNGLGENVPSNKIFIGLSKEAPQTASELPQLKLEMDRTGEMVMTWMYAAPSALDRWKKLAPGTRVSFRGRIVGILFGHVPIRGGINNYVLTVDGLECLGEAKKESRP